MLTTKSVRRSRSLQTGWTTNPSTQLSLNGIHNDKPINATNAVDGFLSPFDTFFKSGNHSVHETAKKYLKGLFQSSKRNMERMAEVVPDSNDQVFQNFLTHSSWDYRPVLDRVAEDTNRLFGNRANTGLIIDESGFEKKGKRSVGVARQWNGRLGKVENSQVGVFAALVNEGNVGLVDTRLYLPTEWTDDPARCAKANIPVSERSFKTKPELALEMVRHARQCGIEFEWVGADALYGNTPSFLAALDQYGELFVVDVHKDQRVFLENPEPYLPAASAKGRKPTRYLVDAHSIEVRDIVDGSKKRDWKKKTLRSSSTGHLQVEILRRKVWVWEVGSARAHKWHLIVRREIKSPDTVKYSLSNASSETSALKLAKMQAQRYWIERAFQDLKSHVGMAQYQARQWQSWHRHMTLVMLAGLFMLQLRITNQEQIPYLSCYDIQVVFAHSLSSKQTNTGEIIAQMQERHRRRARAVKKHQLVT